MDTEDSRKKSVEETAGCSRTSDPCALQTPRRSAERGRRASEHIPLRFNPSPDRLTRQKSRSLSEGYSALKKDECARLLRAELARGLKRRAISEVAEDQAVEEVVCHLHPRASIALPRVHASEYIGEAPLWNCVMSMVNSVIGSGILSVPYCFLHLGLVPGTILVCTSAMLTCLSCFLAMMASKTVLSGTTFSDLGWKTFPRAMWYIDLLNSIGNIGTISAFLIVVADLAPEAWKSVTGMDGWLLSRTAQLTLYSVLLLWPIIHLSNFYSLRHVSLIAVMCVVYILVLSVLYALVPPLKHSLKDGGSNSDNVGDGRVRMFPVHMDRASGVVDFIKVIPIIIQVYGASQNAVGLTHELKNNSIPRVWAVCLLSYIICLVIYLSVGVAAYSCFTDRTQSDVLKNYPSNSWFITILRVTFTLAVSFSYPMILNPARENVAFLWKNCSALDRGRVSYLEYLCITYGIWLLSFLVSLFTTDLGMVMSINGSISGITCLFIVPGLMFYYRCTPNGGELYYQSSQQRRDHDDINAALPSTFEESGVFESTNVNTDLYGRIASNSVSSLQNQSFIGANAAVTEESEAKDRSLLLIDGEEGCSVDTHHDRLLLTVQHSWNVWPTWMTYFSISLVMFGVFSIPLFIIVQFI